MQSFSLETENQYVKFWTTDDKVREKVIDYIEMVIDSERHRRYIYKADRFIDAERNEQNGKK